MQYLVSVIDDTAGLATPGEMAAISAFSGRLEAEGHRSSPAASGRPARPPSSTAGAGRRCSPTGPSWSRRSISPACGSWRPPGQWRRFAHWVSSPMVTNVSSGCRPAGRADSLGGSRPLKERDATSVSRTTAGEEGSGKVGMARRGDEGEEFAEFLVGLERIAAQFVGRADRVRARRLPDQLLERQQILVGSVVLVLGAGARCDHLRHCLVPVSHPFRWPGRALPHAVPSASSVRVLFRARAALCIQERLLAIRSGIRTLQAAPNQIGMAASSYLLPSIAARISTGTWGHMDACSRRNLLLGRTIGRAEPGGNAAAGGPDAMGGGLGSGAGGGGRGSRGWCSRGRVWPGKRRVRRWRCRGSRGSRRWSCPGRCAGSVRRTG